MEPTSVSIIITNHNYGRFVAEAVESALGQTVPCQVVVVDDGSTDDSLERLEPFSDRVTVVAQANGGQASAFNAGWAAAEGNVVFFLDADDRLAPDAARRVVDALSARPSVGRCQFRLGWIDGGGRRITGSLPEAGRILPSGDLADRVLSNPDDVAWQPTSGNAFSREVLTAVLPMPTEPYRISADHYLSNLSPLYGAVVAIEEELGFYRVHGDNADHREGVDLARLRDIMIRTVETRRLLIEHGRRLGHAVPSDPSGFRSLTHSAARLASFRLARSESAVGDGAGGHPFPGDRYRALVADAVVAAGRRSDLGPVRRLQALAWVAALAVAPASKLESILGLGLTR